MSDYSDERNERGASVEYIEELKALALKGSGMPADEDDREEILAAMFALIVSAIKEYAAGHNYVNWRDLEVDLAEQFECGWINPDAEQLKYLEARSIVQAFEHKNPRRGNA